MIIPYQGWYGAKESCLRGERFVWKGIYIINLHRFASSVFLPSNSLTRHCLLLQKWFVFTYFLVNFNILNKQTNRKNLNYNNQFLNYVKFWSMLRPFYPKISRQLHKRKILMSTLFPVIYWRSARIRYII
jgi:hypothetical protein